MIRLGMPQANSTISMPRCTLARASAAVLPCSRVTSAASSSKCLPISSRKRNMTRARSTTGVSAHCGSAAAAAWTARSTSSAPHSGTLAMTFPDEGLKTSPQRLAVDDCHFPPHKSLTSETALWTGAIDPLAWTVAMNAHSSFTYRCRAMRTNDSAMVKPQPHPANCGQWNLHRPTCGQDRKDKNSIRNRRGNRSPKCPQAKLFVSHSNTCKLSVFAERPVDAVSLVLLFHNPRGRF